MTAPVYDTTHHAQVDAYARVIEQREQARNIAALLESETVVLRRQLAEAQQVIRELTSNRTAAFFGAWECGCTQTERSPALILEFCPTHGDRLVSDRHGRTKVELIHSGVSGYGVRDSDGKRLGVRR